MIIKKNIKDRFQLIFILLIITLIASIIGFSLSARLDNDAEVEFNSELIYYLDITYDGVDKYGIESDDNIQSEIISDYIYIEDKIPEGLIFNGFVTTSDQTFGAVSRDDSNKICSGSIIDDSTEERTSHNFIWKDWDDSTIATYNVDWGSYMSSEEIGLVPTREGYTFERWSEPKFDENLNVIYKAIYKGDSMDYIVEWYDIYGEILKSPETRSGTVGSKVSVTNEDKTINGYALDTDNKNNILSTILSPKTNILRIYFIPLNKTINSSNTLLTNNTSPNEDYTYNYHGLHYDEKTRTVSFKVKNLQAGCKITIGIKTITPESVDDPTTEQVELRRDFYNFGTSTEKDSIRFSNTVHTWMGTDKTNLYSVSYEYTGDIPASSPQLPQTTSYSPNSKVGIALEPIIEGYRFTGWTTEDASVTDNTFIMPSKNITFRGSFEKLDEYKVTYEIEGLTPEGYIAPLEKYHSPNSFVKLDSLKKGDIFNGYRFLGWTSNEIIINDDQTFIMPEKDITIIGQFERVTYKVEYRFYDTILPPNSDSLLPPTKEYSPGEEVSLENPINISGYRFLGWYKEYKFIMPESDVVVYGEWQIENGLFTPSIKKEIINEQDYYRPGDIVYYNISITNNANYPIKNVIVEEKNKEAEFYSDPTLCTINNLISCIDNYNRKTPSLIEIPTIPANSSISLSSRYIVSDKDQEKVNNEVEMIGALADNYYYLDTSREYKSSTTINIQSKLKICKEIISDIPKTFQFHITDNENYDSWINLSNNKCSTIYLKPNSYNISEVIPQEYTLKEITLSDGYTQEIISNNDLVDIELGKNYEITFKNNYRKKGFYHSDGRIENKVKNEKNKISINIDDYYKEYDGENNYEMSYSVSNSEYENLFDIIPPEDSFINAGTYQISPKIIWKNEEEKSKYILNINKGELVISPRRVTIKSGSASKEYDGLPLTNNNCEIISGSIISKDKYICNVIGSQLNVGSSSNIFNIIFNDSDISSNYTITKVPGILTITEALPTFTVIYTDGVDESVFENQTSYELKVGAQTPSFLGSTYRDSYTFMGWSPTVNPVVSADDADENRVITYTATWMKN